MTNEMQLAQAAGLSLAGPELPPGTQPNQYAKATGMKKIHRLLRGRYPLVISLGILFAVAGGLLGYLSQEPLYTSVGKFQLSPIIISPDRPENNVMQEYNLILQSQISMILGNELVQRALDEDVWKNAAGPTNDDAAIAKFGAGLDVENPAGTALIRISYTDADPKLAQAGTDAMCQAYLDWFKNTDPLAFSSKLTGLDAERKRHTDALLGYQNQLSEIQRKYHTDDLTAYQTSQTTRWAQIVTQLADAKLALAEDLQALSGDAAAKNGQAQPLTEEQVEVYDANLRTYRSYRDAALVDIARLKGSGMLDANPKLQSLQNDVKTYEDLMQQRVNAFNAGYRIDPQSGTFQKSPTSSSGLKADIALKQGLIKSLEDANEKQEQLCTAIGNDAQWIADVKANITRENDALNAANFAYDNLQQTRTLNDPLRQIAKPIIPSTPSTDRRKAMAVIGFLGGGITPALLVLLVGVLDSRLRYSDETNSDLGGVPLLGILPNLPDLLTDPSQAATAAHCVHQIRTILQITGYAGDRRVFAITSASPGDGKTSLTLALGLSFAASGSRTLLVDGDLIGGGLTARLNVNAEHGVLEAMASRDIMPYIRATDVADLSFLPVGQAMGGYTGTISPAAVRRLVNEARNNFDIILIDTGPILGSIEASPVAVAADGVVLCVSRGQQRQLVDRALAHMQAIGAKLAGVVFNRAQAQDFERSTNRLGLGSAPAANGRQRGEAIGPVARAVASSVRTPGTGGERRAT